MEDTQNKLEVDQKKTTPSVLFLPAEGKMSIKGDSYPENSVEFYRPLIDWLERYFDNKPPHNSDFVFELNYFNTSSSKAILDILDLLDEYYKKGNVISITWRYESDDEDIKESGEEFAEGLEVPFQLLEI
ncbi:MAG: biofilm formation regulator SiaD modulator protein SiaC [Candidatus Kapaibacteriales bacterium]